MRNINLHTQQQRAFKKISPPDNDRLVHIAVCE